jgi:tetratricopeptide (TPR) repeat protein
MEGRYDDAASCFARASSSKPNFSTAYIFQAISLSLAGRTETAGPIVRRALELEPSFRFRVFHELGLAEPLVNTLFDGSTVLGLPQ